MTHFRGDMTSFLGRFKLCDALLGVFHGFGGHLAQKAVT